MPVFLANLGGTGLKMDKLNVHLAPLENLGLSRVVLKKAPVSHVRPASINHMSECRSVTIASQEKLQPRLVIAYAILVVGGSTCQMQLERRA